MDCCGQCLDYFCVGPRANREKFRPWKKKSRAVLEAEERAREEKGREEARKHRKNNNPTRTQNVARLSHHHSSQRDHVIAVTGASPASPHADEATPQRSRASQSHGGGQGVTSQSQEQIEQLRRQLDEAVAARRKAEAERDASEKRVEELQHSGHDPRKPQASQPQVVVEGGPSSSHMMPSGSTSNAGRPSTFAASLALD
ncbi:hypothetical protein BS17DRAFT_783421 [Gyrodon lividus]|nr:hypothetical protein BS17DRAFT_783421 [Gyrodon lividus]